MKEQEVQLLQRELELVRCYRENPILAANDLLNVDLAVPQQKVLLDMWFKSRVVFCGGRGSGKSFLDALFACLWATLWPGQKVGLLAPSFRQAKVMFSEVDKIWSIAPLLQECTSKSPITASDRCYLPFKQSGNANPSIIEAVPLGDGCLVGTQYLTTEDGFYRFDDLVKVSDLSMNHQVLPFGKKIWSNGEFRYCDEIYYNGIRETKKITTNRGYVIEGTLNHKIKIIRQGRISWAEFSEIQVGDYVLLDRSYRWPTKSNNISADDAYTLGLLIGDGCWTSKYIIGYASKDEELVEAVRRLFPTLTESTDGVHFTVNGKDLREEWLTCWGLKTCYPLDKELPSALLQSSRESVAACLSGLFDTDGTLQVSTAKGGTNVTVSFTNTSKNLVNQIHYILLHFGIVSTLSFRDRNENWNRIYELFITGRDVKRFAEQIGFRLTRKKELLLSGLANKKRDVSTADVIPGIVPLLVDIRRSHRIKKGFGTKSARNTRDPVLIRRKEPSRADVRSFIDLYSSLPEAESALSLLREMNSDNIYYDYVESIESGSAPTYDAHIPDGHEYCAGGFYSHNSKIRGARYHVIIADEFAQIPVNIFNAVIKPMGATSASPMEKVRRLALIDALIKSGKAKREDFEEEGSNKIIVSSSAFFQFNHMYETINTYQKQIAAGDKNYAVHHVSYRDMPKGFLDENNIRDARLTMPRIQFRMEYEAIWEADSAGVFKASLVEECKKLANFTIKLKEEPGKQYIIGVDPARSSDGYALVVMELGVAGQIPVNPHKVVAAWEFYQLPFPLMADFIIETCKIYRNVVAVHMDAGAAGGGPAVKDLLAEEKRYGSSRILDANDETTEGLNGRRILHMFYPAPQSNAEAVYGTLNLMEQKMIAFPEVPLQGDEDVRGSLEIKEQIHEVVEKMLSQLTLIEVTESKSGVPHFDVPEGGGHGAQKKDLYSAFVLAAKKAYDLQVMVDTSLPMADFGIIENILLPTLPERNLLASSMEVINAPINSWTHRKTFKPSGT